jgi:uncharacterized protein (TIGR03067 family)
MKLRALLFLLPFHLAADAKEEAAKQDLAKMQGRWISGNNIVDGKPTPADELKNITLEVKGDRSDYVHGTQSGKGMYTLDPTQKPKTLDIVITDGFDKGKTYLAIYEFDGAKLRICHARPGKPRPTKFESKAGSGDVLETWEKAKP